MSVPASHGPGREIPRQDEQRVILSSMDQLESLILAQNERWRQA
jgi:hypothetical protein